MKRFLLRPAGELIFPLKTILDKPRSKKRSKSRKRKRLERNNVSETLRWFIFSLWRNGEESAKNDWSTLNSSKIAVSILLVNEEQLQKRTDYWKFKICQKEDEKQSVTKYKRTPAEIQLATVRDFGKMSTCRTRRQEEIKNSNFRTTFSTTLSQVSLKISL